MNPSAQATAEPPPLDPVYTTRDDIARTHNPATPYERMLLTAAAQAWQRYQQALDLEKRLFAKTDPLDLFSTNLEAFKAITRHVATCEGAWRRAMEQLERAQRSRAKQTLASPRPRTTFNENRQNEPNRAASAAATANSSHQPDCSRSQKRNGGEVQPPPPF